MAENKKEKVDMIRGILVSDQFLSQQRLSKLALGQVYLIKRHWLKYVGKIGSKHKFQSLTFKGGKDGKDGSVLSKVSRQEGRVQRGSSQEGKQERQNSSNV